MTTRAEQAELRATSPGQTIHGVFAAVARDHAERTALVHDAGDAGDAPRTVSYAALRAWSGKVARRLGMPREASRLVGLLASRSPARVAATLGIWDSGAAYLPLDPRLPDARLAYIVEDSGARTILVDSDHAVRMRRIASPGVEMVAIPELRSESPERPDDSTMVPPGRGDGSQLAYVIYTSGSTGRPKGVLIEHRSVVALAANRVFGAGRDDVFLQLAPFAADPSIFELTCPLLNGATLIVPGDGDAGVDDIVRMVVRHRVTVLRLVAPLFHVVMETSAAALRGLRLVISGGDRASERAVRTALRELPDCTVVNGYGPTESTIYALCHAMRQYDERWPSVPIGTPIDGVTAAVVDDQLRPVPDGAAGELVLGGVGLARGYLGQPALTGERFVTCAGDPRTRLYRTGDRVRRLPDGALVFLGRTDHQVKVRGYRVELGEIEGLLAAHAAVDRAAAVVKGEAGAGRIEAFVTLAPGKTAHGEELRAHLVQHLADYMVPNAIWILPALPETATGKVDRAALARAGAPAVSRAHRSPPRSELERRLAQIWQAALGVAEIGVEDAFLDLGGHSLAAMQIAASATRELGVHVPLSAMFDADTVRALAARLEGAPRAAPRTRAEPSRRTRLSPAQEGLWFEDQRDAVGRFTIARTFRLHGELDVHAFRAAIDALARRQDVLRSTIESDAAGLWQSPRDDALPVVEVIDVGALAPDAREARARRLVEELVSQRLSPATGPVMVVHLISLDERRWVAHFQLHHLIADDWSLDLLFEELAALYNARRAGVEASLPVLDASFADHAGWDREAAADRGALDRWRELLRGYDGALELPNDFARPAALSGRGGRTWLELDEQLTASIAGLARAHQASSFMVMVAALYLMLSRYSDQDDLCVGTPVARRDRPGAQQLIGYFVNLLPLRIRGSHDLTVAQLLTRVRQVCIEALELQDTPLHAIVREVGVAHDRARHPLFQVVVAYQQRAPHLPRLSGVDTAVWRELAPAISKFDLGFDIHDHGGRVRIELEYSSDLFEVETAERMIHHFGNVLRWVVQHPTARLSELTMLAPDEEHRLLVEWNHTDAEIPERCLHELVADQARARPDKLAVIGDREALTYRDLEDCAARVAARLVRLGLALEDRVAILLERSPRLVAAILGVLKAGGAYVPLDPSYPHDRLAFTVEDSRARILITSARCRSGLPAAFSGAAVVDIDEVAREREPSPGPALPRAQPHNLAYIIYTSGSTRRPRGALIEHRSVVNTLYGHVARYPFADSDVWSQFASAGFDMAVYEQFMPLLTGATSVICSEDVKSDGRAFVEFVDRHRVSALVLAPAFLRALGKPELSSVRFVITGGEAANMEDVAHYARTRYYLNCYGPTETTVCATTYQARAVDLRTARLPIGKPLANYRMYVLDRTGRPAPVGVPGELCIAGIGLARGYWNNSEATRDKFVTAFGQRLYRTGDRVRWLRDGNLDFLGRVDHQVKLRGFRIELGEIEAALGGHPGVAQAAVVLHRAASDDALFGFFVAEPGGSPSRDEIVAQLAGQLPAYMIPSVLVALERMPLTEHDKIDRRALTRLAAEARQGSATARSAEPRSVPDSPLEARMAALWREVLDRGELAVDDDFFEVGGHSLLIVRLLARIEDDFGARLAVNEFLAVPTVRGVAERLARAAAGRPGEQALVDGALEGRLEPMTFPPARPAGRPRAILLTGGTGFVGAFVLRELLQRTDAPVFCLVRAGMHADVDRARARLGEAVRGYRLGVDPGDPRIIPVVGDLAERDLGLDPATWSTLRDRVDAIVHCGAHVHHFSPYHRLKPANVEGTRAVIRLAAEGCAKRLHHVSTLSVFAPAGPDRQVTERSRIEDERHLHGRGYSASKWVADRLVLEAVSRGAQARIYRLGRVSGETARGIANPDDMFYRLLASCAALGCYPNDPGLRTNLLPVDVLARSLVALALEGDRCQIVAHLHHTDGIGLDAFMRVRDTVRGVRSEPTTLAVWLDRARGIAAAGQPLAILPYLAALDDLQRVPEGERGVARYVNDETIQELTRLGISVPPIDAALIERYWRHIEEHT
jgi:amino acid adenylation domain-containing protein/thioester reductase-like protein